MKRAIVFLLAGFLVESACALSVSVGVQNETCSYMNGSCYADVNGGVPPYTYLWSTSETTYGINGLGAGTYSVTVTDFVGTQATAVGTVASESYPPIYDYTHTVCPGQDYHAFFMPMSPPGTMLDVSPWTTDAGDPLEVPPPAGPGNYYLDMGVADGSSFSVNYWDANGCQGTLYGTKGQVVDWPTNGLLDIEGSCTNISTGTATFSTTGEGNGQELFYVLKDAVTGDWNTNGFPINGSYDVFQYGSLAPGDYWQVVRTGITYSLIQGGMCASPDSILITIPLIGTDCGSFSGTAYMDYNSDCVDNEINVPGAVVEILPGPYYATTSSTGNYSAVLPYGSYSASSTAAAIAQSCPAAGTIDGVDNTVVANIGHQPTVPLDAAVGISSGAARPGFEVNYHVTVFNQSSSNSGATTTTFTFDPALSVVSMNPAGIVNGSTITWSGPSLGLYQSRTHHVSLQVPPDVGLIGTDLLASASVTTFNADADLGNNNTSHNVTVTGSYDPNDKTAATSTSWSDALYYIDQDSWIDYTIRFQNTGTDTAFNIVITDTLPASLDPATISMVAASHGFSWSVAGHGVLRAFFPNILLPDSNVNEPLSHGLVSFRIRPRLPLLPGTVIENIANIYFDFNPPVITEPSVLTAEFSTGVVEQKGGAIALAPVPSREELIVSSADVLGLVRVLSADGREVLRMNGRSTQVRIDLSALPCGAYLLEAGIKDNTVARERFIKQ